MRCARHKNLGSALNVRCWAANSTGHPSTGQATSGPLTRLLGFKSVIPNMLLRKRAGVGLGLTESESSTRPAWPVSTPRRAACVGSASTGGAKVSARADNDNYVELEPLGAVHGGQVHTVPAVWVVALRGDGYAGQSCGQQLTRHRLLFARSNHAERW